MKKNQNKKTIQKKVTPMIAESAKKGTVSIGNIVFFGISLIILHFLFVFLRPEAIGAKYNVLQRLWGFDHISFYPWYSVFIFYCIGLMVCIPTFNKIILDFFEQIWEKIKSIQLSRYKYILFILLSIIAGFIFYKFKIKYDFLGDMNFRVGQTLKHEFIKDEYFTMFSLFYFNKFMHHYFSLSGHQVFVLHSILSGVTYVFISFLISNVLGENLFQKTTIFLFHISAGVMQFFFGYVEIYSIPAMFYLLYIFTAILCIKNKLHIIFPFIVLVFAILSHLLAVGLLPSLGIIFYWKYLTKVPLLKSIKTKQFIIFVLCCIPVIYIIGPMFNLGTFMPVFQPDQNPDIMTVLSFKHIWEFLNSQILASGMGFFVLLYLTFKTISKKIVLDKILWFFVSVTFFMLFIVFISNPVRGSGDWDILSFPAIGYNLMGIYFLFYIYNNEVLVKRVKYLITILIVFNFMNSITWVGINHTDKSIKKIANMLEADPGYYYQTKLPAVMQLAFMFKDNKLTDKSLEYFKKSCTLNSNDPRSFFNYSNELLDAGRTNEAIGILEGLVNNAPFYPLSYNQLIQIYEQNKMHEKSYSVISRLFDAYLKQPNAFLSRMDKKQLVAYFSYLYNVEMQQNNEKASLIAQKLNELK